MDTSIPSNKKDRHLESGCQFCKLKCIIMWPRNILLDIYSREERKCVHTSVCTQMFLATLLMVTKKYKQISITWWIDKKLWYIPVIKYHLAIKNDTIEINLQKIILKGFSHKAHKQQNLIYMKDPKQANYSDQIYISGGQEGCR